MDLFSITGRIALEGIDSFNRDIDKADSKGSKFSKGLGAVSAGLGGVALALGTASVAFAGFSVKTAMNFESSMSKVQAISGSTADDMMLLTEKAKEMGKITTFSASESAEAFQYMAMAGWETESMLDGISGVMDLASASGEELALVSDIVTDSLTAFGMEAKQSTQLADLLASVSSSANTNVSMMGETFKYAAPVVGALGYSAEDAALAVGLMANAGIKASQSGTALRGGLTNLVKPSKKMKEAMDELDISIKNQDGSMKDMYQVIEHLRERFSGLTKDQKANKAAAIFGKEAMSGWLAVINASPQDFDKLTKATTDYNGKASEMSKIMNDNLQGSLKKLESQVESVAIEIGNKLLPVLTDLVDVAGEELPKAVDGAKGYINDLSEESGWLSEAWDKIVEGTGPVFEFLLENLKIRFGSLADIIKDANLVINAFHNQDWKRFFDNVDKVFEDALKSIFGKFGTDLADWTIETAEIIVNWASEISADIEKSINEWVNPIVEWFDNTKQLFEDKLNEWKEILTPWFDDTKNTIIEHLEKWKNALIEWAIEQNKENIKQFKEWRVSIEKWFEDTKKNIKEKLKSWKESIILWFEDTKKNIPKSLDNWWDSMKKWFEKTKKNIETKLDDWWKSIKSWFNSLGDKQEIQQSGNKIVKKMHKGVEEKKDEFIDKLGELLVDVAGAVIIASGVAFVAVGKEVIERVIKGLNELSDTLKTKAKEVGGNIVDGLSEGITGGVGAVVSSAKDLAQSAINSAKNVLDSHSPSRVFEEIGGFTAEGFVLGLINKTDNVKDSAFALMTAFTEVAKKEGDSIKEYFQELTDNIKNQFETLRDDLTDNLDTMYDAVADSIKKRNEEQYNEATRTMKEEIDLNEKKISKLEKLAEKEDKLQEKKREQINEELELYKEKVKELEELRKQQNSVRTRKAIEAYQEQIKLLEEEKEKELCIQTKIDLENLKLMNDTLKKKIDFTNEKNKQLLDENVIAAEAEQMLLEGNQEELIGILESYNPEWLNAGKSFGERFVEGLSGSQETVKSKVTDIMSMVSSAISKLTGRTEEIALDELDTLESKTRSVIAKMKANSAKYEKTDNKATKSALHEKNLKLGQSIGLSYENGTWYLPSGVEAYASGGRNIKGGWAMVGEQGAELVKLPSGSDVYNAAETKQMIGQQPVQIIIKDNTFTSKELFNEFMEEAVNHLQSKGLQYNF